jgi:DNA-directed RNA polymerase specialized sigma24 family protein
MSEPTAEAHVTTQRLPSSLVVLHYYLGVPLPEAASSLGISLGAAKSRLHRAMGSMRASFSGGRS